MWFNSDYIYRSIHVKDSISLYRLKFHSESQIRHLDLSHCQVEKIDPFAFRGLEKSLESIDLSANRLRKLPKGLFEDFDLVRKLKLNDNMLTISPNISFNGFR